MHEHTWIVVNTENAPWRVQCSTCTAHEDNLFDKFDDALNEAARLTMIGKEETAPAALPMIHFDFTAIGLTQERAEVLLEGIDGFLESLGVTRTGGYAIVTEEAGNDQEEA